MRRGAWLLPLLLLGAGCAYYNGMYNAKRLAGRARKAEREGRTFEASSFWGQVSIKAESVLVRHPDSKWADEARLLQGTALERLRDCDGALPVLEQVMLSQKAEFAEEAALLVGGCRVRLGDPVGAMTAYARLARSDDPARRQLALYAHGRALRIAGDYSLALEDLAGTDHPRALGERGAALAALGRTADAAAVVDSLRAAHDTLAPWPELFAAFASHDADGASMLVGELGADSTLPAELRARLLLDDAVRLASRDAARAEARFEQATALVARGPLVAEIHYQRMVTHLRVAATAEAVDSAVAPARDLDDLQGPYSVRLGQLAAGARRVLATAESTSAATPHGDLRVFLAAELARDTLGAVAFARREFARVAEVWPESPFAPKALMALAALDDAGADSLLDLLRSRYPASPYVRFGLGEEAPELAALEDSLRRFVISFNPEGGRRAAPRPNRPAPQPTAPREPVNR